MPMLSQNRIKSSPKKPAFDLSVKESGADIAAKSEETLMIKTEVLQEFA